MNTELSRFVIAGLLCVLIFVTGYWLSRAGKPYSALRFNIHKFSALGTAIFMIWFTLNAHQGALAGLELAAVIIAVVFALATIISGGLLSTGKPMPTLIALAHKVLPYMTTLTTALTLYILLVRAG